MAAVADVAPKNIPAGVRSTTVLEVKTRRAFFSGWKNRPFDTTLLLSDSQKPRKHFCCAVTRILGSEKLPTNEAVGLNFMLVPTILNEIKKRQRNYHLPFACLGLVINCTLLLNISFFKQKHAKCY